MQIKLISIIIENFKGIRDYGFTPNGKDVTVYAENGVGKTTIFDAFLWLLFGKNSEGKTDFAICPLDGSNRAVKGLVTVVEAMLSINGEMHTFRKERHERAKKGQVAGYEAVCSIDEVPKKKGEYDSYIADVISEDVFKMLTDLQHFNTMHWTKQREILVVIAGEIGTPSGFDEMLGKLNGRSIADYKKVLTDRKKAYGDERDEVNPRLDEIRKRLAEIGTAGTKEAGTQRAAAITEKVDLQEQKQKILDGESKRQGKVDAVNAMKVDLATLENTLKQGDTTKIGPLLKEKIKWGESVATANDAVNEIGRHAAEADSNIESSDATLRLKNQSLQVIREEYPKARDATLDGTCSACGQSLPTDKLAELENQRAERLRNLAYNGNDLKDQVAAIEAEKAGRVKLHADIKEKYADAEKERDHLILDRAKAVAEIDKKIADCKSGVDPTTDDQWKRLDEKIKGAEKDIGPSLSAGLGVNDTQTEQCQARIDAANLILANTDTIKKDKARIAELEEREKELAQLIADIEADLQAISEYGAEESKMVEEAVNCKFEHTTFKLFNRLLNESIEPTCEAMLNGTPYSGMSTGEKIFVGVDEVNVLSKHFDASVVLFVDHRESLTLPLETDAQVISLFAEIGTKELTVK